MRKLIASTLFAGAAAAAAITLSANSAFAATFNVSGNGDPDGNVNALAPETVLTVHDPSGDVQLVCSSSDGTGNVPNGDTDGQPAGTITSLNFNDCVLGGSITFTVETSGFAWPLNADSQTGDVVSGSIGDDTAGATNGIGAHITGLLCDMTVSGPSGPNDGKVPAQFDNVNHQLIVSGGGNLQIHDVASGECLNLVHNGDAAEFSGTFDIDQPIVITQTS